MEVTFKIEKNNIQNAKYFIMFHNQKGPGYF